MSQGAGARSKRKNCFFATDGSGLTRHRATDNAIVIAITRDASTTAQPDASPPATFKTVQSQLSSSAPRMEGDVMNRFSTLALGLVLGLSAVSGGNAVAQIGRVN